MKKHGIFKSMTSVLLVLILLMAVGAMNVYALYGSPSGPSWSDGVALWNAPDASEGEVSYYYLTLYKDHSYIDNYTAYYTSYNFNGTMEIYGPGWYTFSVGAVYSDGTKSSNVSSAIYKYSYPEEHTHTMEFHSFTYPTCTEKGCKGYYVCTDCGKWYWDEKGENEITDHDEAFTDPIGHDWGEWKIVKEATTTSEGKAQRVCKNDENHVESYVIPKLKSKDEKPSMPKATEANKTEATESTEAETKPAETKAAATEKPTVMPTDKGEAAAGIFGNRTTLIVLIVVGVLVLIVIPIIVILIVVSRGKKKKNNQPPTNMPLTGEGYMPPVFTPQQGAQPPYGSNNTTPDSYPPTNNPPTNKQ